jgi:hypothetical protein
MVHVSLIGGWNEIDGREWRACPVGADGKPSDDYS